MNYPWKMWVRQTLEVARLEFRNLISPRRALPVYLLALMPLFIVTMHAIAHLRGWDRCDGSGDLMIFAGVFQLLTVRGAIFFGCVVVFLNLFRGEVLHKSLHYWFLAPVRREVLVLGKYLAGACFTGLVFAVSTAVSYSILMQHMRLTESRGLAAAAMGQMPVYSGISVLACLGYGAVFLLLGMLFRNPIIPAVLVLLWESLIVFVPALLKKISIVFYLESLCPVRVPFEGVGQLFAIPASPSPAYVALPGLLLLTAAVVALAARRVRSMEIRYGSE